MSARTLLQVNSVGNFGSTGRIAEEIGQTALAAGWRSVIAFGRNPRASASELIRIGSDFGVLAHALRSRIFDDIGFGSRRATEKFIREAEKLAPDIVHLHNLHGYFLNIDVLFRWLARAGVPVVWTLHDCWAFTGHCAYFDFIGCSRWQTGCHDCQQTRGYPASFLFDRSRKNWEQKRELFSSIKNLTLVPVSDWLAGLVKKSFLGDKKIVRIYNGTDTATFSPKADAEIAGVRARYGIGGRFMALGVASVWGARKGLQHYIDLAKKIDPATTVIVMVGVSPEIKKTLPENIIAIPRTESVAELAELYAAADVSLNFSYEETFGMTTAEALACGTPGIVFRKTASPELVSPETGFVVAADALDETLSALEKIRARGKNAFIGACRERAQKLFDKKSQDARYIELYAERMGGGGIARFARG